MMQMPVVIVDDSDINLTLLDRLVTKVPGLVPRCFRVSADALVWCEQNVPGIVIVDYMMPAPDGIELTRRLRALPGKASVPVLMVTANDQKEVRYEALEAGVTDFLTKPIDKLEFTGRLKNMAALSRSQRLLEDRAALLSEEVAAATTAILQRERETIFRLSKAAEYRDPETGAHIVRMAHYSRLIAEGLGLSPEEQQTLFEAAPMHDIGKVATPDEILLKPARLTRDEFEIMKRHASVGHSILAGSTSAVLQAAALIAISHHERFDGSGYPNRISGEGIPLFGRIVAVADVFDALTSDRPYKRAWDVDAAADFIRKESGSHFDPVCVDAFFAKWEQVLEVQARYGEELDDIRR
jgi:putative two-component system response regulator